MVGFRSMLAAEYTRLLIVWLNTYPLHNKICVDSGEELLSEFNTMIANNYEITCI